MLALFGIDPTIFHPKPPCASLPIEKADPAPANHCDTPAQSIGVCSGYVQNPVTVCNAIKNNTLQALI
jgi:hypothetical protein